MQIIIAIVFSHTIFISILLLTKKNRQLPDLILFVWFMVIAFHFGIRLLGFMPGDTLHLFEQISGAFVFVHGPLFLLYVLANGREHLRPSLGWHFIPFALNLIMIPLLVYIDNYFIDVTLGFFKIGSCIFYPAVILRRISRYHSMMENNLSKIESNYMLWLRTVMCGLLCVAALALVSLILNESGILKVPMHGDRYTFAAFAVVVYIISYFGLQQTAVFVDMGDFFEAFDTGEAPSDTPVKYKNTGLSSVESQKKFEVIESHIKEKGLYRDPELTLQNLSAELEISPHHLSQIINQNTGLNFYNYINRNRVYEVIEEFSRGEHKRRSLLDIALSAGFNSKSTFNRFFKTFTTLSPSEYIRKLS